MSFSDIEVVLENFYLLQFMEDCIQVKIIFCYLEYFEMGFVALGLDAFFNIFLNYVFLRFSSTKTPTEFFLTDI